MVLNDFTIWGAVLKHKTPLQSDMYTHAFTYTRAF